MNTWHQFQWGQSVCVRRGKTARFASVTLQEGDMVFVTIQGKENGEWVNRTRLSYGVPEGCRLIREEV